MLTAHKPLQFRRGNRNACKQIWHQISCCQGFPGGWDGKESTCNVGDLGSIPGLGRPPGGGHGSPLQYSCLENPHGQRSLAGYSPWGHKALDTTEWLTLSLFTSSSCECNHLSLTMWYMFDTIYNSFIHSIIYLFIILLSKHLTRDYVY